MSNSPGQISCTVANDFRLISAGAAAVSAHAARRAGLSREAQEEIGDAAVQACEKAFRPVAMPGKSQFSFRVEISDLSDRVEVTLDGGAAPSVQRTTAQPRLELSPSENVRYEISEGFFRMTISKACGAQDVKRGPGDSSVCR